MRDHILYGKVCNRDEIAIFVDGVYHSSKYSATEAIKAARQLTGRVEVENEFGYRGLVEDYVALLESATALRFP